MALFYEPAVFEVKAKVGEALAAFGKVNLELEKLEKKGMMAAGALGKIERSAMYARTALLGMGGVLGTIGVVSLHALDGFEKAQARLETAVRDAGVSFQVAEPAIKQQADAFVKLGFSYTDTYDALAKMTAASGSPLEALKDLSVAADIARFKNMSLAEAGSLVAKASVGAARGLLDMGIKMGATVPKGASFEQILAAIEKRIHGTAEAFSDTLAGKIAIAQANFQRLEIEIGTKLLPYAIRFTDWIVKTAIPAIQRMSDWISKHIGLMKILAGVLAVVWAVPKFALLIEGITLLTGAYRKLTTAAAAAAVAEKAATTGAATSGAAAAAAATAAAVAAAGTTTAKTLAVREIETASATRLAALFSAFMSKAFTGFILAGAQPDIVRGGAPGAIRDPQQSFLDRLLFGTRYVGAAKTGTFQTGMSVSGATDKYKDPITDYLAQIAALLKGNGVQRYDTVVNQNFVVYAKDANAMTIEAARAARNGLPLGLQQTADAVAGATAQSQGSVSAAASGRAVNPSVSAAKMAMMDKRMGRFA